MVQSKKPGGGDGPKDKSDSKIDRYGGAPSNTAEAHDRAEAEVDSLALGSGNGGPERTEPSGELSGSAKPRGKPTEIKGSPENQRSLKRENESAKTLAENGYDVLQNPPRNEAGKDPDYKIEGKYFDCYAPARDDPGRIRDDISRKVKKGQADHIVLNLDDSGMSTDDLKSVLERRPVSGLQEIKIVKDGKVVDYYPF